MKPPTLRILGPAITGVSGAAAFLLKEGRPKVVEAIRLEAQGSPSKKVTGFLSGDSWGFPGGSEGLGFDLGGTDAGQWEGKRHLAYAIHRVRPSFPLPRSVPGPP
jgi:hypothetical protein